MNKENMSHHKYKYPISTKIFLSRVARNFLIGVAMIIFSLGLGMEGYMYFEKMERVDAFLNASMILSGMGPVSTLHTESGKIFAGCYALYSGSIFLITIAIILTPIAHRILYHFMKNNL